MSTTELTHTTEQTTDIVMTGASSNAYAVYLAGRSAGSRRTMADALAVVASIAAPDVEPASLPWHALRPQHVTAIRAALADRYAPATANKILSALRGVLRECWRLGQMSADDYHRTVDIAPVRGERAAAAAGRAVELWELVALANVCSDGTPAGARDTALLGVLYAAGLRRSEIVSLDVSDLDPTTGALSVTGKGRKTRTVYVQNGARAALLAWLDVRGSEAGPLFCRIRRGGHVDPDSRLTSQAVYLALDERRVAAGLRPFTPHDLRRTFAGDLLDAGADLATVQGLMGHSSPATTARYDRRGERAKMAASAKLSFPYDGGRK